MADLPLFLPFAAKQLDLITRQQLRRFTVSRDTTRRYLDAGILEEFTSRVLRIAGSPDTEDQRTLAAVFDAGVGAVLSHGPALRRWGVMGISATPVEVSKLRPAPSPPPDTIARVHLLRALPTELCTVLGGIPIVRPEMALYQWCGQVHPDRAERAIDAAWRLRLVSGPSMKRALHRMAKQGRNGTVAYRALLEPRGDDYIPPASGIESRFTQILRDGGHRPMRRQVDCGGEQWNGRVDFLDEELPFIVEILSEMHHTALVDKLADEARRRRLEADGFTVLEIWDTEVWTQPGQVLAKVRADRQRVLDRIRRPPTGFGSESAA